MTRAARLAEHDIMLATKLRQDCDAAIEAGAKTYVLCFETEKDAKVLAHPHTRGMIHGLLMRIMVMMGFNSY